MDLITIRELYKNKENYLDQKLTVGGWVRSIRDSKTFGFIVLNDGTFFEPLQIVYHDKMENFTEISKLNVGAAVIVTGTLVATPQAKQPFEIQADSVEIEGASAEDEHLSGCVPHPLADGIRPPQIFSGERLHLCPHAADYRKRLRGRGRDVPRYHAGYGERACE